MSHFLPRGIIQAINQVHLMVQESGLCDGSGHDGDLENHPVSVRQRTMPGPERREREGGGTHCLTIQKQDLHLSGGGRQGGRGRRGITSRDHPGDVSRYGGDDVHGEGVGKRIPGTVGYKMKTEGLIN